MKSLITILVLACLMSGCAKLPLDNGAPAVPELSLSGPPQANNVAVEVTVDDPDGDRISLKFIATHSTGATQDFAWTSFLDSGETEVFYLGLSTGTWTLSAKAKDEWEEESKARVLEVVVP
jgi:hypothetical protein